MDAPRTMNDALPHHEVPPRLIGVIGGIHCGKDTVGAILHERMGYELLAFADALKNFVSQAFTFPREWCDSHEGKRQLVPTSSGPRTVRHLLEGVGAAMRRVDPLVWARPVVRSAVGYSARRHVITDVRYENEVQLIRENGGVVWRIDRPGHGEVRDHDSDRFWRVFTKADAEIMNDGDLDDLYVWVQALAKAGGRDERRAITGGHANA